MRKAILILAIVLTVTALTVVPTLAGKGNPQINREGHETGKARQAGPNGPNYGGTPVSPISIEITPTPTPAPKSESGGGIVYRIFLPSVCKSAGVQVSDVQLSSVPTSPGAWD